MDNPIVNESSFSAANPSSYSLSEIWSYPINGGAAGDVGLRMGNMGHGFGESSGLRDESMEESTVTEQSGGGCGRKRRDLSSEDESSKIVSTTTSANDLNDSNGKRMKTSGPKNEKGSKAEVEASSEAGNKPAESSKSAEPPKDYIHVRARRGQATDSHSLSERARREKISERMKNLQDLVPGCNKVIGKALVLDEIINYVQSLQQQVEFMSMKLEAVNSRMSLTSTIPGFNPKDLGAQAPLDATGMIFGSQAAREYVQAQGSHPDWLHMQVSGSFERAT